MDKNTINNNMGLVYAVLKDIKISPQTLALANKLLGLEENIRDVSIEHKDRGIPWEGTVWFKERVSRKDFPEYVERNGLLLPGVNIGTSITRGTTIPVDGLYMLFQESLWVEFYSP